MTRFRLHPHLARFIRDTLAKTFSADDAPARSVKTIAREGGGQRQLSNRLTDEQVRELVAAFEAGATRMELAEWYGIGRTSVAKLLRQRRVCKSRGGAA